MKAAKPTKERKSSGTLAVEKYRPRMNKLTDEQREELTQDFLRIYHGGEAQPAPARRR